MIDTPSDCEEHGLLSTRHLAGKDWAPRLCGAFYSLSSMCYRSLPPSKAACNLLGVRLPASPAVHGWSGDAKFTVGDRKCCLPPAAFASCRAELSFACSPFD